MSEPTILDAPAARAALARGARVLADAVGSTLGPRGRTAVLATPDGAAVTTEGMEVARAVRPADPHAALGAFLLASAAARTRDGAGAGATTTIVLGGAMADGVVARLDDGADGVELGAGMAEAVRDVLADLRTRSEAVDTEAELRRVATTAALGDEEVGGRVAEALRRVGREAPVVVLEGDAADTVLEPSRGLRVRGAREVPGPGGADGGGKPLDAVELPIDGEELEDALVAVCDLPVPGGPSLLAFLEKVARAERALVLVAPEFEGEALELLRTNQARGTLELVAFRTEAVGDRRRALLDDLSTFLGARTLIRDLGLRFSDLELADLGSAARVVARPAATTFVDGGGRPSDVHARIGFLRRQMEATEDPEERAGIRGRLAALAGGVAVLRVGGRTREEIRVRRVRAESALAATRTAAAEGVVPGGGVALLRAADALDPSSAPTPGHADGIRVVAGALAAPLRRVAENAWADADHVVAQLRRSAGGVVFDAGSREIRDLDPVGLHDPTRVLRLAVQEAAGFARTVLDAGIAVADAGDGGG